MPTIPGAPGQIPAMSTFRITKPLEEPPRTTLLLPFAQLAFAAEVKPAPQITALFISPKAPPKQLEAPQVAQLKSGVMTYTVALFGWTHPGTGLPVELTIPPDAHAGNVFPNPWLVITTKPLGPL